MPVARLSIPTSTALRDVGRVLYFAYAPLAAVSVAYYATALLLLESVDAEIPLDLIRIFVDLKMLLPPFLVIAAFYGYGWLIINNTGERPFKRVAGWLRKTPFIEIALLRILPMGILFNLVNTTYLAFKRNIPEFVPFSWDAALAEFDRALFFGRDPWEITHALLPWPGATWVMCIAYGAWLYVTIIAFAAAICMPLESRVRMTFLLTFALGWAVGGSFLATVFSSAGPVYVERLFADATFAPLMEILEKQNETWFIGVLQVQEKLWLGYSDPAYPPAGISAFPSMHLCMSATVTLFVMSFNRWLGWMLVAFTALMLVSSVHLAWHYAVDGIAGIALAILFWRASQQFVAWWFRDGAPAT